MTICEHTNTVAYWHENDDCGVEDCKVDECLDCGMFQTDCWDDWQEAEYLVNE